MQFSRLQRVGYAQRTGRTAIDSGGFEYEILDIYILGTCYAIRLEDLVRAIAEHGAVRIEELSREWKYYLGAHCGLAQVSAQEKVSTSSLFTGGLYHNLACRTPPGNRKQGTLRCNRKNPGTAGDAVREKSEDLPGQQRISAFA